MTAIDVLQTSSPLRVHLIAWPDQTSTIPLAQALLKRSEGAVSNKVFERLHADAQKHFVHVPPSEADVFVYAHVFQLGTRVHDAVALAKKFSKRCVFFKTGDDCEPSGLSEGVVFRESLVRSRRQTNEFSMPAFVRDPEWAGFPVEFRDYSERPKVGFCGFVGSALQSAIYSLTRRKEKAAGLGLRRRTLSALRQSKSLDCLFVERRRFRGGAVNLTRARLEHVKSRLTGRAANYASSVDQKIADRVYREFLRNMNETDYTLCIRGAGNYSYRFFETLAAGRVPFLIDTDCVLPFDSRIDWARHVASAPERNINQADRFLVQFHSSLNPDAFLSLQQSNRRLFETWFEPLAFYCNMFRLVLER